jgi:hypothetical protein
MGRKTHEAKRTWLVATASLVVLLLGSSALAGSVAQNRRFQRDVRLRQQTQRLDQGHLARRQHNRCTPGWKRYRVSDIFGKGMARREGCTGQAGAAGFRGPGRPRGAAGLRASAA